MKFGSILATFGYLALLLVMQNATAGERSNGVIGNTLCLNADARDAIGTYGTIEKALGTGSIEAPSDNVSEPRRPNIVSMPNDALVGPYFSFMANEPNDVNLDLVPMSKGGDRSRTELSFGARVRLI
jgi:hypothetical protein